MKSQVTQASGGKVYETHFEVAERLGVSAKEVARRICAGEFPTFASSGGVYYIPTQQGPHAGDFFEKLIAVRYGLI